MKKNLPITLGEILKAFLITLAFLAAFACWGMAIKIRFFGVTAKGPTDLPWWLGGIFIHFFTGIYISQKDSLTPNFLKSHSTLVRAWLFCAFVGALGYGIGFIGLCIAALFARQPRIVLILSGAAGIGGLIYAFSLGSKLFLSREKLIMEWDPSQKEQENNEEKNIEAVTKKSPDHDV